MADQAARRIRHGAREIYEQNCAAGRVASCVNLGASLEFGEGGPKNLTRARALYERGCAAGNGMGCNNLGIYQFNYGWPGEGMALLKRACQQQDEMLACYNLGLRYEKGDFFAPDAALARQLFNQACRGGPAEACRHIGYCSAIKRRSGVT